MARQVGKDYASGAEGIRDCVWAEEKGQPTTWLIAAPSERQSLESFRKWTEWAREFKLITAAIQEERQDRRNSESLLKSSTIEFPGDRKPETVPTGSYHFKL